MSSRTFYKMKLIKAKVFSSCIFPCALKPDSYFYFFIFSFEGERPSKCRSIQRKTHQTHSVSKILWTRRLPNCPWTWFERKQNSVEGKSLHSCENQLWLLWKWYLPVPNTLGWWVNKLEWFLGEWMMVGKLLEEAPLCQLPTLTNN